MAKIADEPVTQSLGGHGERSHYVTQTIEKELIRDGSSLVVVDPKKSYKIVGICLAKVSYRYRNLQHQTWSICP